MPSEGALPPAARGSMYSLQWMATLIHRINIICLSAVRRREVVATHNRIHKRECDCVRERFICRHHTAVCVHDVKCHLMFFLLASTATPCASFF